MSFLSNVPLFREKALAESPCKLTIKHLGEASTLEEAWKLLPRDGEGIVVLSDKICRLSKSNYKGYLIEADIVKGQETTVLRSTAKGWSAWRWSESPGDDHIRIGHTYLSSENDSESQLLYCQYWRRQDDDGIAVWLPVGSRFAGFN